MARDAFDTGEGDALISPRAPPRRPSDPDLPQLPPDFNMEIEEPTQFTIQPQCPRDLPQVEYSLEGSHGIRDSFRRVAEGARLVTKKGVRVGGDGVRRGGDLLLLAFIHLMLGLERARVKTPNFFAATWKFVNTPVSDHHVFDQGATFAFFVAKLNTVLNKTLSGFAAVIICSHGIC